MAPIGAFSLDQNTHTWPESDPSLSGAAPFITADHILHTTFATANAPIDDLGLTLPTTPPALLSTEHESGNANTQIGQPLPTQPFEPSTTASIQGEKTTAISVPAPDIVLPSNEQTLSDVSPIMKSPAFKRVTDVRDWSDEASSAPLPMPFAVKKTTSASEVDVSLSKFAPDFEHQDRLFAPENGTPHPPFLQAQLPQGQTITHSDSSSRSAWPSAESEHLPSELSVPENINPEHLSSFAQPHQSHSDLPLSTEEGKDGSMDTELPQISTSDADYNLFYHLHPDGSASDRLRGSEVEDLSNVELVERLAIGIMRRRENLDDDPSPIAHEAEAANKTVDVPTGLNSAIGFIDTAAPAASSNLDLQAPQDLQSSAFSDSPAAIPSLAGWIGSNRPPAFSSSQGSSPEETERALRNALASLQRMSGTA